MNESTPDTPPGTAATLPDGEQTPPPDAAAPAETPVDAPDEATDEVLRLQLDQFEGPFEVLLYLIKSQEIDIFDIPIVQVTEQYLRFLEILREENLDVAGEFLVMAATLIQIKSRMILPIEVDEEEDEELEEEDPRLELVEKLLEYRKFRDLGEQLGDLHEQQQDRFARLVRPRFEAGEEEEDDLLEVSLYDLVKAVRGIMRFIRDPVVQQLAAEAYSIDEKVNYLENILDERSSVSWSELFEAARDKLEVVCYLLAILELCRMNRIRARQHRVFGEIRIFRHDPGEEDAPDVGLA